jgi:hypothetical protein
MRADPCGLRHRGTPEVGVEYDAGTVKRLAQALPVKYLESADSRRPADGGVDGVVAVGQRAFPFRGKRQRHDTGGQRPREQRKKCGDVGIGEKPLDLRYG